MKQRAQRLNPGPAADSPATAWSLRQVALWTCAGSVLLWAAFPPLGWSPCAWLAPVPWLWLCRAPEALPRRSYGVIWLTAALFWGVLLQGIRKAHPANYLGLLALACYLAVYLPAFVSLVRGVIHRSRVPLWLAAPVVWTGLELLRGGLFTGFSIGLLGHTQVHQVALIQIADVTGAYGVSFLVMLGGACLLELWPGMRAGKRWLPAAVTLSILVSSYGYGWYRLGTPPRSDERPLQVALLQGTRDKVFEYNPSLDQQAFEQYDSLMMRARASAENLDLIVWPEGAFTALLPELIIEQPLAVPDGVNLSLAEVERNVAEKQQIFRDKLRRAAAKVNGGEPAENRQNGVHLILGATTFHLHRDRSRHFNGALWIDPRGEIAGRYYKMHLVMFGEYVPFSRWIPWLNQLTPIGEGMTAGERPAVFDVADYRLSPSICFESTVPHLIRKQLRQVQQQTGEPVDILVNITDDGWFWGSSILDLHVACGVFRAVEMRRPFLVAANTGISAAIDGNGRIQQQLPHRREGFILAAVSRDGRFSLYERCGDVFAGLCLMITVGWGVLFLLLRRSRTRRGSLAATK